jgi:U3 small nucleolar ribonucleoprotein component
MEQTIKMLQNNLKQKDKQIQDVSLKLQTLTSERGEMIKMIAGLTKIMQNDSKVEQEEDSIQSKSPESMSWADEADAKESKNDSAESNVVVDPIDEQLGKKGLSFLMGQ